MKAWRCGDQGLEVCDTLLEALELLPEVPRFISLVGGGGKTSLMYRLAKELSKRGERVVVTTSTHIACPREYKTVFLTQAEEIKSVVWGPESGFLVVGQPDGAGTRPEKLKGMAVEEISKLGEYADVVLIEADGAKRLPIKIPRQGEPVIIPETELVIGVAGLDCVGRPLSVGCFRWESAGFLKEQDAFHQITLGDVACIMTHPLGGRKGVMAREYKIVLNKADGERELCLAEQIIEEIKKLFPVSCVVTKLKEN